MKTISGPDKETDLFLKKHVGLIHCENKLTLVQRKLCNVLLFNALDKIDKQEIHEISLRKLCSLVGYKSNDIKLIKESIKSLISVVMEWNLLEDAKSLSEDDILQNAYSWNASSLLAGASIKKSQISYSYSPQMKSILSRLDIYGRINLFVQAKFNSTYSLVLYENCVRFKNIKKTTWFALPLFRTLMGVAPCKYQSFKEFKRNVITVAVNEINQKSDIKLSAQFKKTGSFISAIQFLIEDNENYRPLLKRVQRNESEEGLPINQAVMEQLINIFQLSMKQATDLVNAYPASYLTEKINLVVNQKNIKHKGAYLIAALKQNYQKNSLQAKVVSRDENCQRVAQDASQITSLKNKYMAYRAKKYQEFVLQQPADMQAHIKESFEYYLQANMQLFKHYQKKSLISPMVMSAFIKFMDDYHAPPLGSYLSFDDFLTCDEEAS